MNRKVKQYIDEFIKHRGEDSLLDLLSAGLSKEADEYTLTIVCNRGVHALPDSLVRGEEFTLSEGRSVDTSSRERMHDSVKSTEALVRLMDDYDLAGFIVEAAAEAWISSDQLAALWRLDAALERYAADDQEGNDADRIATSEWRNIRGAAEAALRSFVTTAI